MKRSVCTLSLVALLWCGAAVAQDFGFDAVDVDAPAAVAPGQGKELTLTPEMYRYLADLQRYGGPQDVSRMRAMAEAEQRKERLNAMRWYGYSNSRPMATATPFMGTYGPRWVGNVRNNPYYWRDLGHHQTYISSQGGVPGLR
jgi:hypothetical protein